MTPSPRTPPDLRLAVLCESIGEDAERRPYNLFAPVHTLRFPLGVRRDYQPPTLSMYIQLQGGTGTFYVRVVVRRAGGTATVYQTLPEEIGFGDDPGRVFPIELALELDGLAFPEPDVYEAVVYANHVSLNDPGSAVLIPFPPSRVAVLPTDGSDGGVL